MVDGNGVVGLRVVIVAALLVQSLFVGNTHIYQHMVVCVCTLVWLYIS